MAASAVSLVVAATLAPGGAIRDAAADEGGACTLRGSPLMPKGVSLFDAATGGRAIASFAGQPITLSLTDIPADPSAGRARARTGGGLRIDGFVDPREVPLFAGRDLPVAPGHVWIPQGRPVRLAQSSASSFTVESTVRGPIEQTVRGVASCDALALDKPTRPAWDVPGSARGYVAKRDHLDLRGEPGGAVVFTAQIGQAGSGLLLWSTEPSRQGFVHVVAHEDLTVDAWVAASELSPLPKGEMMDQQAGPTSIVEPARLAVSGTPVIVRAQKEVPIRLSTQDAARPVGAIEVGGEVYVMETIVGWTSVLPRSLDVLPSADHSFWVRSFEIGISSPGAPDAGPR